MSYLRSIFVLKNQTNTNSFPSFQSFRLNFQIKRLKRAYNKFSMATQVLIGVCSATIASVLNSSLITIKFMYFGREIFKNM
ncbi:hypothetical protein ZOSMA_54G01030 [Zostera marina]|uniref:Uncharacterized protein n=1 Tax=Zostera marina TaxID=29655 RepID=A0A0K9NYX0_ZOSMR|nr:hypothetical protein ZOSMA_54G01030 [Zostera marina]